MNTGVETSWNFVGNNFSIKLTKEKITYPTYTFESFFYRNGYDGDVDLKKNAWSLFLYLKPEHPLFNLFYKDDDFVMRQIKCIPFRYGITQLSLDTITNCQISGRKISTSNLLIIGCEYFKEDHDNPFIRVDYPNALLIEDAFLLHEYASMDDTIEEN